ncbi:MAG: YbjN domain-containing protein, partial [Actinomycetales bacterium]|nr:YbjN domain-containing protein [Candidatus Phosphoribacter hodrii]
KVYARINDEGQLRVISEHTLDYEHGLTDEQLNLHVNTGIATSCQLWERLNEAFPEAAAAAAAE